MAKKPVGKPPKKAAPTKQPTPKQEKPERPAIPGARLSIARDAYPDEAPSFSEIADPKRRAYLAALCVQPRYGRAAKIAGIDVRTAYNWRKSDPAFAAAEDEALAIGGRIGGEDEAWRRATEGVEEPVYQGGRLVGTKQTKSDTLLMFMLKGMFREKYRERFEHMGKDGGPIEHRALRDLSDAEIGRELALLERAEATAAQGAPETESGSESG